MTTQAMTIREAFARGRDAGESLASWNADAIQFGAPLARHVDWIGVGRIETAEDWMDAFECIISAADEHSRCYSPFEFTAAALNARDSVYGEGAAEAGWEAYERGLRAGAEAWRRRNRPMRALRRDAREWREESGA